MNIEKKSASATEKYYMASQWQLVWRKFKKHKLAAIGGIVLSLLYFIAIFSDFLSPYAVTTTHMEYTYSPPMRVRFSLFDQDESFRPHFFVYGIQGTLDPATFRTTYREVTTEINRIRFFVKGERYRFWGVLQTELRLFGVEDGHVFLFGTDRFGRDAFSRNLGAARISLSIGLVGVALSFVLGALLGGISGYYGGRIDMAIQRVIEVLISLPTIPFWMALSVALPTHWHPIRVYFGITIILSILGWTVLARIVRGRMLELREEDFVMAARLSGCREMRIIVRHLLPGFSSYLIVHLTLSVPWMILAETSLSFLGLGLRTPVVSWGVLLVEAQNIRSLSLHPWLLIPGVFVIITVLAFNFLGEGLRDAADPYK